MLKFLSATALILAGIFVLFLVTAPENNPTNTENTFSQARLDQTDLIEENADFDNRPALIIGDPNAPATLVEYGDFKCPACNQFHHTAGAQIRQEYVDTGQANIEFRNYPFLGPDSGRAARGSYCANDQGVFMQYHDKVYEYLWANYYTQGNLGAEFEDVLTLEKLVEIMREDLVDVSLFEECLSSTDYNRFIDADLLLGADDGITGTPGFVVGEQRVNGPSNFNTFKTLLDIEINKNQ